MDTTATRAEVFEQLGDGEARAIVHWRFDSLLRAGYAEGAALVLAAHVEVDLHAAVELVSCGCPPETALRILL